MTELFRVLSLGWGIQSTTLAAMSALGDLEPVDAAIHADTTHEARGTYAFAAKWKPWLIRHGIRVETVYPSKPELRIVDEWGGAFIPAYTIADGVHGQIRRQCTGEWKVAPIRRWLQRERNRQAVEMWIGISLDEWQRMKDSDVQYITNRWPLVEKRMTRNDCVNWLERHNLEVPSKSACVFCPYHDRVEWRGMKASGNGDWRKAVEVDEAIRKARPPYDLFLHADRIPLVDVDLSTPQDHGQLELWQEVCESGYCWT